MATDATPTDVLEELREQELAPLELDENGDPQENVEAPEAAAEEAQPVEEAKKWAGKYDSPDQLESAYSHAERKIGEQANEMGQMRQRMQELESRMAPQPQQQQAQQPLDTLSIAAQMSGMTREQLTELHYSDPARATALISEAAAQKVAWEQAQKNEALMAPLHNQAQQFAAQTAVGNLIKEYGEEAVTRHGQAIYDRIVSMPDFYVNDASINYQLLSDTLGRQLYEESRVPVAQPRDDQTGQFVGRTTHVEGGSSGHTPSGVAPTEGQEVDPVHRELSEDRPQRDRFGGTPFDLPLRG